LERGRYVDYLAPWLAAFPATVHVRFLEETASRDGAVGELYAALGVDPDLLPADAHPPAVNRSNGAAPALAPELASRLRRYFEPADRRLSELLGRELPWSAGRDRAADTL
jgi:hypothetical protein